jgi:hypothetical protein
VPVVIAVAADVYVGSRDDNAVAAFVQSKKTPARWR